MTRNLSKEEIKNKLDGEELDLSLCSLTKVPVKEIAALPKARVVDLSCNSLTTLTETFCSLRQLVRLDLSKNALKELPQEFGNLNQLKELDLYCNQLSGLPLSCVNLENLIWLDLKSNPVQKLWPDVIGNCLSKAECKQCAKNVLRHLKILAINEEQAKLAFEKEQKALEEEKEQHARELRKRQKQQEKQLKREAYEATKRHKKEVEEERSKILQAKDEYVEPGPPEPYIQAQEEDRSHFGFLLFLSSLITIGIAVALVFFCHKDATCQDLIYSFLSS